MTGPRPGTPPAEAAATTPEPATPGEAAFRHYMTGGDRPDFARQAWLGVSFEVRDRWEEVAGAAIAHDQPPGWVSQIRQDRDALKGERDRLTTENADLEREMAEAGAMLAALAAEGLDARSLYGLYNDARFPGCSPETAGENWDRGNARFLAGWEAVSSRATAVVAAVTAQRDELARQLDDLRGIAGDTGLTRRKQDQAIRDYLASTAPEAQS